jgi:geranylgeranyl diphosphate synthase type II
MKNAEALSSSLEPYLAARRAEIDAALMAYLPVAPGAPAVVADAMRYSVVAGGKRLRPVLTLTAAEAIGGESARALALPCACAIEMIHTYSLIHDDLPAMDDDVLRRGRPTLHVVAGDGMAILAGDGLQAEAFRLMAREPVSDDLDIALRKLRVIELVADAAGPRGMVGGQAIDLHAVRPGPNHAPTAMTASDVQQMHARKTGALIRAATVAGSLMAGASDAIVAAVAKFATEIGLAFQIVDDVLDVEAASETLGKTAGKDAAAGKPTYPSLYGVARSRQMAIECLERADSALGAVMLEHSHLAAIAHWIVTRRN